MFLEDKNELIALPLLIEEVFFARDENHGGIAAGSKNEN
jgi:hypothetical protein